MGICSSCCDDKRGHQKEPQPGSTEPLANSGEPRWLVDAVPQGAETAQCHHVYDGDTLTLTNGKRVRLLGIDTPELKEKQPFAEEAKRCTQQQCSGQTVYLEYGSEPEDRFGRKLAYVYVKSVEHPGKFVFVNAMLLCEGLARFYSPGAALSKRDGLLLCMSEAKNARAGQWASFRPRSVVLTPNGKCYHAEACQHIRGIRQLTHVSEGEALDRGLSACRDCLSS